MELEELKGRREQMKMLAEIVNAFESEAVQLKVLEHLLADTASGRTRTQPVSTQTTKAKKKPSTRKPQSAGGEPKVKRRRTTGEGGAKATLNQLAEGDFFSKPRTIGAIVQHCKDNLARVFKPNDFSGKLARMVREGELKREKNADGQYEYTKP